MNQILQKLSAGDLRSDGLANEVVRIVLKQPRLIVELIAGLDHSDETIRGHAADALEKIARSHPELLIVYLPKLITCIRRDPVAIVRMHLAMIFGHLAACEEQTERLISALLALLEDERAFVVSWAIVSLCIFARKYPRKQDRVLLYIGPLQRDRRAAIRSRVKKAVRLLTTEGASFPKGWIKSEHLGSLAGKHY